MDRIVQRLKAAGQSHVLRFWDALDDGGRSDFRGQLEALDLVQLDSLYNEQSTATDWDAAARRAEAPPAIRLEGSSSWSQAEAVAAGEQLLREGQVGVVLVAGGQGTRLGFEHPKGMFPLGPVSQRTLFEMLVDRLLAIQSRYGGEVPLYVMTSPATHEETVSYFERQRGLGLADKQLYFFCQGTMPALEAETGQLLLADKGTLFTSPDGHGGMLSAFAKSGCLADAKRRGISQIFYAQVDNPLAQICDPLTIGYHCLAQSEMTTQVIPKREATERVGNVVSVDGQVQIIEYSDFPADVAAQTESDGSLRFWAGSIAVHIFTVPFLERSADNAALPFHKALKKTPYLNESGQLVEPDQPNSVKFEQFIFDLMPLAENAIVVEIDPAEGFAPVKNAPGAPSDTASTAQQAIINQARRRLALCGVTVPSDLAVEINPRYALDLRELAAKTESLRPDGKPLYLH